MKIRVVELFAGDGGFRLGLEGWKGKSASSNYIKKLKSHYKVIWSNQWEPSTNIQHANLVYKQKWPRSKHNGSNIEKVIEKKFNDIPNHDLLVGGFPCQDYSVATTLKNSKGLVGKKGILWWSIYNILKGKGKDRPKYLLLENVDRLLVSPASQRGRDFAIMLSSLNELGYAVEWKVINTGEYGMPQKRRRVFIFGYHKNTGIYNELKKTINKQHWIITKGLFSSTFPSIPNEEFVQSDILPKDVSLITKNFNKDEKKSPFRNSGVMINSNYYSLKTISIYEGPNVTLGNILVSPSEVSKEFYIKKSDINNSKKGWLFHKGGKKIERTTSSGFKYQFAEGKMKFPDDLNTPSRTIVTGEGGTTPTRFKHVVKVNGKYRRLVPKELERLNMFPDDHTNHKDISDVKRAFFMGNALVVGAIDKLGLELANRIVGK